jgi:hypothetical protein
MKTKLVVAVLAGMTFQKIITKVKMMSDNLFMDDEIVTISLPKELAHKMVKPWYLMKQWHAEIVREAFREALKNESK